MPDQEAKLKKLERVLELLDDSGYVKTEEFVQLFEALLKILRQQLGETVRHVKEHTDGYNSSRSELERRVAEYEKTCEKFKEELTERVENIELTPGDPGKDADEDAIFERLKALIPPPQENPELSPEEVANKVNSSKVKIKKSQIEGLEDIERMVKLNAENSVTKPRDFDVRIGVSQKDLENIRAEIQEVANSVTGGGTWIREDVTGDIDGVNDTFTLSQTPESPDSLILSLGRQIQIQDVDFTLSGSTITYTSPPDAAFASEPHVAQYQ